MAEGIREIFQDLANTPYESIVAPENLTKNDIKKVKVVHVDHDQDDIPQYERVESFQDFDGMVPLPVWVEDFFIEACMNCEKKFKVTRRKHHCRMCGQIFCSKCSNFFAIIPQMGIYSKVRICVNCKMSQVLMEYEVIDETFDENTIEVETKRTPEATGTVLPTQSICLKSIFKKCRPCCSCPITYVYTLEYLIRV